MSSSLPPDALALAARLYGAARTGDADILKQALEHGLPPNMQNEKGDTLLMLAAYHGHAELVSLLILHKASPNICNDRGQSPLAGAVFKHEKAVIEALLEGGADPEIGTPSAMAALDVFGLQSEWKARFEGAKGRGAGDYKKE